MYTIGIAHEVKAKKTTAMPLYIPSFDTKATRILANVHNLAQQRHIRRK
jgi:hypothetical protein